MKTLPSPDSTTCTRCFSVLVALALGAPLAPAQADNFGSGSNSFTIDFVTIANPGNGNDAGAGGGLYSSPYGGVGYTYRMGVTEVAQDWITRATSSGLANVTAGAWTGLRPAAFMMWYEAAAFVNWLNTSTGHQAAYDLTRTGSVWTMNLWSSAQAWQIDGPNLFRHKDAYYFLPSEDEWYKAAYHKNDGVTTNYWDYATGSNSIPTAVTSGTTSGTAVYDDVASSPAAVNSCGGLSAYGTIGQSGNVWEQLESAYDGINNTSSENRAKRGGNWFNSDYYLSSRGLDSGISLTPTASAANNSVGFRVASVPEPSTVLLLSVAGLGLLLRRRRA